MSAHAQTPRRSVAARLSAAVVAVAVAAAPASADTVNFASVADMPELGTFTGSVSYTAHSSTTATIQFVLNNTTPLATGNLTGFGFNVPTSGLVDFTHVTGFSSVLNNPVPTVNQFASIGHLPTVAPTPAPLRGAIGGGNLVDGTPYGMFDLGAATFNGTILGIPETGGGLGQNGLTGPGIAAGGSGTFTFNLKGTNLNLFSAADLVTLKSSATPDWTAPEGTQSFVARFTGFNAGQADRDFFAAANPVPAPPSAVLAVVGLGVGLVRRARRARATTAA